MARQQIVYARGGTRKSTVAMLSLTAPKSNALLGFNDLAAEELGIKVDAKYCLFYDPDNRQVDLEPAEEGEPGTITMNRRVPPPTQKVIDAIRVKANAELDAINDAPEEASVDAVDCAPTSDANEAIDKADALQARLDAFDADAFAAVYFSVKHLLEAAGLRYDTGFTVGYQVDSEGTITFVLPAGITRAG